MVLDDLASAPQNPTRARAIAGPVMQEVRALVGFWGAEAKSSKTI